MSFDTVQQSKMTHDWKIKAGFVRVMSKVRATSDTGNTHYRKATQDHQNDDVQQELASVETEHVQTDENPSEGSVEAIPHTEVMESIIDDDINEIFAFKTEAECHSDLIALKAKCDPDTIYYHQAMQQPDKKEFKDAMTNVKI